MAVDVKNLIAAINPDIFCDDTPQASENYERLNKIVKKIAEKDGYLAAAEKAKPKLSDYVDVIHTYLSKGALKKTGLKFPIELHKLNYDVFSQSLEPIYYWVLDYVNEKYGSAEKLVDNFVSAPGGAHFSEMSQRATIMQDKAMQMFQTTGVLIKSIINIIYDLKEYDIILEQYSDLKSEDRGVRDAAMYALKQRWMDNVDIKRGNSSVKAMAQQFDYVTLIDAFMAASSLKKVDELDLNDRVKRILQQRVSEFLKWLKESERELRKRYEIERIHLRSQVNNVRIYARWVKPYLKAVAALEQRASPGADYVNVFNSSIFELVLLAKGKYGIEGDVQSGELPRNMLKMNIRKYTPLTVIEMRFRSAPERTEQRAGGYGFRGRVDITFSSYALTDEELKILRKEIEKDDVGELYGWIMGSTEKSLEQLQDDLDKLLGEGGEKKKEEESSDDETNPFSALFSFLKKKESVKKGELGKESWYEELTRSQALMASRWSCRRLYDDFKKAHGMPALPPVQF